MEGKREREGERKGGKERVWEMERKDNNIKEKVH